MKLIISENQLKFLLEMKKEEEISNFSTSDNQLNLKRYVEYNIDFEGYDEYKNIPKSQKIESLIEIFKDEYGWAIKNMGLKRAFIEWLQGLPSILDIPFYYDDMKNLMYSLGYDQVKEMEDIDIANLYYNELFKVFFGNKITV